MPRCLSSSSPDCWSQNQRPLCLPRNKASGNGSFETAARDETMTSWCKSTAPRFSMNGDVTPGPGEYVSQGASRPVGERAIGLPRRPSPPLAPSPHDSTSPRARIDISHAQTVPPSASLLSHRVKTMQPCRPIPEQAGPIAPLSASPNCPRRRTCHRPRPPPTATAPVTSVKRRSWIHHARAKADACPAL